ncbi:MAG: NAD-dependent epimerase/dehydratase family protein [Planctomycetota bacterium]
MSSPGVYIVTGGCGFVGSNLVGVLQKREPGCRVVVVDDFRSGSFSVLVRACDRIAGEPFTGEVIAAGAHEVDWESVVALERPDAVFHLGAITDTTIDNEAEMLRVNVGGFDEMIGACDEAGVPVVYASSAATYGTPSEALEGVPFREASAGRPDNVYGFSKWVMENVHRGYAERVVAGGGEAPRVVGLRFFNVFGPGEESKGHMASMARQLAVRMLGGERPRLFEPGDQVRDQVPVEDVVDCVIASAREGVTPGVYNLGSGRATSFDEVCDAVREGLGLGAGDLPTEYFEMPAHIRAFYQSFTQADMGAAAAGLSWRPSRDAIESLRAYGAWMRGEHDLAHAAEIVGS